MQNDSTRFFKDMPPHSKWNEVGEYELNIYRLFLTKRVLHDIQIYNGKLINAYVKIRLLALKHDIKTYSKRNYYGISWEIKKKF